MALNTLMFFILLMVVSAAVIFAKLMSGAGSAGKRKRVYYSDPALRELDEDLYEQRLILKQIKENVADIVSQYNEAMSKVPEYSDINALKGQIRDIKDAIKKESGERKSIEEAGKDSEKALKRSMEAQMRTLDAMDAEVKRVREEHELIKPAIDSAIGTKFIGLQEQCADMDRRLSDLAGLKSGLEELRSEIKGIGNETKTLKADQDAIKTTIENVMEKKFSGLHEKHSKMGESLAEVEALKAEFEGLRSSMDSITRDNHRLEDMLEARLKKVVSFFEEKTASVNALGKELAALKEQIDAVNKKRPDADKLKEEIVGIIESKIKSIPAKEAESVGTGFSSTQDDNEQMKEIIRSELIRVIEPLNEKFDELSTFRKEVESIEKRFEELSGKMDLMKHKEESVIEEAEAELRRIKDDVLKQKETVENVNKDIDRLK
jgi:chromosome segregation ATPase